MEYKVITKDKPLEVWASGFYGEEGAKRAQLMIRNGYWHRHMYPEDKAKVLVVVPETKTKNTRKRRKS
mgnify:CR=1 FL=1